MKRLLKGGRVIDPANGIDGVHDVLIDDGQIKLRVERVERGRALCSVVVPGTVQAHKGVNVPGVPLPIPSLTRKDIDDLQFALELGVDFVALSFVRSAADVKALRTLIENGAQSLPNYVFRPRLRLGRSTAPLQAAK